MSSAAGIELDGNHATVVVAVGGAAAYSRTITASSPQEALLAAENFALASLKSGRLRRTPPALRVSLALPGTTMRRIDVTKESFERSAFEDSVYTAIPVSREGTTTAGLFFNRDAALEGSLTAGAAVASPRGPVEEAYATLRSRAEIVPTPFTLAGRDGLWLAIRYSGTDMTFVSDGHPTAYRQLRSGGLDALVATLGGPEACPPERLAALLSHTGMPDPAGEAELARFLSALSLEARKTAEHWARSGEALPTSLFLLSSGAGTYGLSAALANEGFTVAEDPILGRQMANLTKGERPAAAPAFLAAATFGADMPQAAFVSPGLLARSAATAKQDRQKRTALLVVGALLLVLLSGGLPYLKGRLDLSSANSAESAANTNFQNLSAAHKELVQVDALKSQYVQLASADPQWSQLLSLVYNSAPTGTRIANLTTAKSASSVVVNLSATTPGSDYTPLTTWIQSLAKQKATAVTPTAFALRNNEVTYTLTFSLPLSSLTTPRSLDGSTK